MPVLCTYMYLRVPAQWIWSQHHKSFIEVQSVPLGTQGYTSATTLATCTYWSQDPLLLHNVQSICVRVSNGSPAAVVWFGICGSACVLGAVFEQPF
jgi:hypothetical protein